MADSDKRIILANPDEPRTGQNGFDLYDQIRPGFTRDAETMRYFQKQLRGLRGHTVTMNVDGERKTGKSRTRNWHASRRFVFDEWDDLLDAYLSTLKEQLKANSKLKLITTRITFT